MNICITRSRKDPYSETFIRNQIKGLSNRAHIFSIHTGRLPERNEEDQLLSPLLFWYLHKALKLFIGRNNYFSNYGIKKFLRLHHIDVVLSNYGLSASHMLPICRSLNIPLVAHFHGHDASRYKILKKYAMVYQSLFSYAGAIICVSVEMEKRLIALGANEEKIFNIPYGVDLKKFQPAGSKNSTPLFLSVGRFTDKKAPQLTLLAFEKVWKKRPDARLIMIGSGSKLLEECKNLTTQLNMAEVVIFTGALSPDEVISYMQQAHIFLQHSLMPSSGDMEGTPNSILEASSCGLAVVSTRHGGIKEAILHGETGFLVEEKDVEGMADYMLELFDHPELIIKMGEAGRRHIEKNYDLNKQTDKLFKVLESVSFHNSNN
jgi:glycosyltransferase involved in cell wall biosynthesis